MELKITTLGTSHIIRKVLQCEAWSLNGGDHRWFKRSTRKKRPVTRDTTTTITTIIIIIIIIINSGNQFTLWFLFTCPFLTLRSVSPDSTLATLHMSSLCCSFSSRAGWWLYYSSTPVDVCSPFGGSHNVRVAGIILILWLVKTQGFRDHEQEFWGVCIEPFKTHTPGILPGKRRLMGFLCILP